MLGPPGTGARVGATEYGGPGDPSSGVVGASGANLLAHPDSYAELGGYTFQTATAMGGLPYMTPLRITWGQRSAIAYKRDFGLGGGPIDGLPRVIDLWWEFAGRLGIPYERGLWSGPVRIERPPATGAAERARPDAARRSTPRRRPPALQSTDRRPADARRRARLLPDGLAAAPARPRPPSKRSSPPAIRSSASPTSTVAATGCRCRSSRRRTTARAASRTCCTGRVAAGHIRRHVGHVRVVGQPGPGAG